MRRISRDIDVSTKPMGQKDGLRSSYALDLSEGIFQDFHNANLCFVCCLFKQINSMISHENFLKAKNNNNNNNDNGIDW